MSTHLVSDRLPEDSQISTSEIVAANVRAEAARRRLSQMDLVRLTGMSQPAIAKRWNGHVDWKLDELDILARIFRITPAELVTPYTGSRGLMAVPRGGNSGYLVSEDSLLGRPPGTRTQNQRVLRSVPAKEKFKGVMPVLRAV